MDPFEKDLSELIGQLSERSPESPLREQVRGRLRRRSIRRSVLSAAALLVVALGIPALTGRLSLLQTSTPSTPTQLAAVAPTVPRPGSRKHLTMMEVYLAEGQRVWVDNQLSRQSSRPAPTAGELRARLSEETL